jgi:hypothetical protein
MRRHRVVLALAALALAASGASSYAATTPAAAVRPAAAASLTGRLYIPSTQPRIGRNWPIRVVVRGAKTGTFSYQFIFNGAVVSSQPGGRFRGGAFHDQLQFPAQATGIPLTLVVVVKANGHTLRLKHTVTASR